MDAIGYLTLGLLGAGCYLDPDTDEKSKNKSSKNARKDVKMGRKEKKEGKKHKNKDKLNKSPSHSKSESEYRALQAQAQVRAQAQAQAQQAQQKQPAQAEVAIQRGAPAKVCRSSNLPSDLPQQFQLELYNTLQLTGSEHKVKNSRWNRCAVTRGLTNCTLAPGGAKPDLGNFTLEKGRNFCTEPFNAQPVPHDESKSPGCEEEMTHTNMVPFYRGNIKQNMDPNNRLATHKLELFTGAYKLRKDNKEELGQFFAPTTGLGLPYGKRECRDMSRYFANNTGKKNNEKPFMDTRVGPGLNKGFTAQPSGGYHDRVRILPKRNDQLYVNPKSESKGKINHGKSIVDAPTMSKVVYKYKPNLVVDNECGQRNFTTVGAVTARRLRPDVILKQTNRIKQKMLYGPASLANKTMHTDTCLIPKTQISRRQNFKNTPTRNLVQTTGNKHNDYGQSGYKNRPNERTITGTRTYWGHLKTFVNRVVNNFTDKAKYTRKQEYVCAPRKTGPTAGNVGARTKLKGRNYDPCDVAKTTIRQTTQENKRLGITGKLGAGASRAYDPTDVARTTVRQTTQENGRLGNTARLGAGASRAYDPCDVAKTTIRQTTQENGRVGGTKQLGAGAGKAYDPTDVARTTVRQTTQENGRLGMTARLGAGASRAYDPCDVAKTTIRQTTQENGRVGGTKQLGAGAGKAYDPTDVAKTTVRQTTQENDRLGMSGKLGAGASRAYDPCDVAKTTIKQTTIEGGRLGMAQPAVQKKSIAYDPTDVAKTTIKQTTVERDRSGIAAPVMNKKSIAYDPCDVAKTTIRQTTQDNDRVGGPSGGEFQNGGAYKTTNYYANNTNRQFTSDYSWTPAAGSSAVRNATNYNAAYNATFNPRKDILVVDRVQAPGKVIPIQNRLMNMNNFEVKKIDDDRKSVRTNVKTTTLGNTFNPDAVSPCTITSWKNRLPEDATRLDTNLLDAFRNNPLTQSLNAYA